MVAVTSRALVLLLLVICTQSYVVTDFADARCINTFETLRSEKSLGLFSEALELSGLRNQLEKEDVPLTILAPTNHAFESVLERYRLKKNEFFRVELMKSMLSYHILPNRFISSSSRFVDATLTTALNISINVDAIVPGVLRVSSDAGTANVAMLDLYGCNSIVQMVDGFMMPQNLMKGLELAKTQYNIPVIEKQKDYGELKALATDLNGRAAMDEPGGKCSSTYQVIKRVPELSIFFEAIESANVDIRLNKTHNQRTVFAPTNAAIESLLEAFQLSKADFLNADLTNAILLYHIIPGLVINSDTDFSPTGTRLTTSAGVDLDVRALLPGVLTVQSVGSNANVALADIEACNATIQLVDTVLLPERIETNEKNTEGLSRQSCSSILDSLLLAGNFTVFAQGLAASPLWVEIMESMNEPVTVFAPTDDAFDALFTLPDGPWEDDPEWLKSIAEFHVVRGQSLVDSALFNDQLLPTTYEGAPKILRIQEEPQIEDHSIITVVAPFSEASIVRPNVVMCPTVVHGIDNVLLPENIFMKAQSMVGDSPPPPAPVEVQEEEESSSSPPPPPQVEDSAEEPETGAREVVSTPSPAPSQCRSSGLCTQDSHCCEGLSCNKMIDVFVFQCIRDRFFRSFPGVCGPTSSSYG